MDLRRNVVSPDRFDEAVFKNKREDPTRPGFPSLLAAQIVPFKRDQKAAFPSLPLMPMNSGNDHDDEVKSSLQMLSGDTLDTLKTSKSVTTSQTSHRSRSIHEKCNNSSQQPSHNPEPEIASAEHIKFCQTCGKRERILWRLLSLPVQAHIFKYFLEWQQYPEYAAISLGLTYEELCVIQQQLNYRKIHPAPLEAIWNYGVATGGLGPRVINPEKMDEIMDYLLFASHYEVADENEVEHGRLFLNQRGFDKTIMDLFVAAQMRTAPIEMVSNTSQNCAGIKRRRNSTSVCDDIDTTRANTTLDQRLSMPSTAPASITTFDRGIRVSQAPSQIEEHKSDNQPISVSGLTHDTQQVQDQNHLKRIRLSIDNLGHAAIVRDSENYLDRPVDYSGRPMHAVHGHKKRTFARAKPGCHHKHVPDFFAAHLNHMAFPGNIRQDLLQQNPEKMQNVDHWLVYGTSWAFLEFKTEAGLVPKPADKSFDPRTTLLTGRPCYHSLQSLLDLHNHWVQKGIWSNGKLKELTKKFVIAAQATLNRSSISQDDKSLVLAENQQKHTQNIPEQPLEGDQHKSDPISLDLGKPKKYDHCVSNANIVGQHTRADTTTTHCADTQIVPQTTQMLPRTAISSQIAVQQNPGNDARILQSDPSSRPLVQGMTPDHRVIPPHTGDTTINVLDSIDSITQQFEQVIEPGSVQRRLFDQEQSQHSGNKDFAVTETQLLTTPVPSDVEDDVPVEHLDNSTHAITKAPSYSPISEQDIESLPSWARICKKPNVSQTSHSNSASAQKTFVLRGRLPGAGMQNDRFMQELITASAEQVIGKPSSYKLDVASDLVEDKCPIQTENNESAQNTVLKVPSSSPWPPCPTEIAKLVHSAVPSIIKIDESLGKVNETSQSPGTQSLIEINKRSNLSTEAPDLTKYSTSSSEQTSLPIQDETIQNSQPPNPPTSTPASHTRASSREKPATKHSVVPPNPAPQATKLNPSQVIAVNPTQKRTPRTLHDHPDSARHRNTITRPISNSLNTPRSRASNTSALSQQSSSTPLAPVSTSIKKRRSDYGTKRGAYKKRGTTSAATAGDTDSARASKAIESEVAKTGGGVKTRSKTAKK